MKQEIYNTLDRLGIDYTRLEHPSIMTMEEGMTIAQKLGVSSCKNLFLVNKQKEYFLLLLSGNKKLSAKSIAKQIGSSHLSFASDEDMKTLLFTTPGAVSILGLIYDRENKVKLLIDKGMKKTEFAKIAGLTPGTLAKLSKNQTVSMDSLIKMCKTLNCTFDDIVEIVGEE